MIEWYYLIVISAILNAIVSIIQKSALKVEHATQYSAASSLLIALTSLAFIPFASFSMTLFQLTLTISFGILASIMLLLSTRVLRHGNLSAITPLSNVLPILFTVVLAYIFLSESLTVIQVACIIGIAAVTYLLLFRKRRSQFKRDFDAGKYKAMLVATALMGSVGSIIGKYLLVNINVFAFLILTQLTAAICLGIFNTVKYDGTKGVVKTISKFRLTFISLILLITSLRIINYFALTVAPINIASPLGSAVFVMLTVPIGGLLFREGDVRRKVMMSAAILVLSYLLISQ